MSDLTSTLDQLLSAHNTRLKHERRNIKDIQDKFLRDAYQITSHISSLHSYLQSIRTSYLSTSQPHRHAFSSNNTDTHNSSTRDRVYLTNTQRDQIDTECKATLRDLNASIRQLEEAETLRKNTATELASKRYGRRGLSTLTRWAAGGSGQVSRSPEEELEEAIQTTIGTYRESVLWYLKRKLEGCMELQRGMMETRIEREVEKSKSVLYKTKGTEGARAAIQAAEEGKRQEAIEKARGYRPRNAAWKDDEKEIEQTLSPEQLQLFAEENNELLKQYEDTLDQVRTAERSMIEISELQSTLAANLSLQSTRIDQLVEDAANTEENVIGGNKQLKKASERWRPARALFYASCGLCAFLVTWDFLI